MNVWSTAFINKQVKQSVGQRLLLYCFNQKSQSVHVSTEKSSSSVSSPLSLSSWSSPFDRKMSFDWVSKYWRVSHWVINKQCVLLISTWIKQEKRNKMIQSVKFYRMICFYQRCFRIRQMEIERNSVMRYVIVGGFLALSFCAWECVWITKPGVCVTQPAVCVTQLVLRVSFLVTAEEKCMLLCSPHSVHVSGFCRWLSLGVRQLQVTGHHMRASLSSLVSRYQVTNCQWLNLGVRVQVT